MGNVGRFLQNAWAETERIRVANEAAAEIARIAAEKARRRRRIAFALKSESIFVCTTSFAYSGGIVLGIFGSLNWIVHYFSGTIASIDLLSGLMYGAILGALIGAVTGYITGWWEFKD